MKVSVNRDELKAAVAPTAKIAQRASTNQMACVLFDAKQSLTVEATDMNESARFSIDSIVGEPGRALVSAKVLSGIAGKLPGATATIEARDGFAEISCGSAVYRVPSLDPSGFPKFSEVVGSGFSMSSEILGEVAKLAAAFASRNGDKPELQGVFMEASAGTLKLTATDSFHGIEYTLGVETDGDASAILPADFLAEAAKGAGTASVRVGGGKAILERENMAMVTRLIEGQYPPVGKLIPTESDDRAIFDPDELSACLDRSVFAGSSSGAVEIACYGDSAKVECMSKDAGSFVEELDCDGGGFIRCSPVLLKRAVSSVGGSEVEVLASEGMKPITVKGSLGRAFVMPMRKQG